MQQQGQTHNQGHASMVDAGRVQWQARPLDVHGRAALRPPDRICVDLLGRERERERERARQSWPSMAAACCCSVIGRGDGAEGLVDSETVAAVCLTPHPHTRTAPHTPTLMPRLLTAVRQNAPPPPPQQNQHHHHHPQHGQHMQHDQADIQAAAILMPQGGGLSIRTRA